MQDAIDKRGRLFGRLVIGTLWLIAGYLVLYYSVLSHFGVYRLHELMGDRYYNLLVPRGGFGSFYRLAVSVLTWGLPLALFVGLLSALPGWSQRIRRRTTVGVAALLVAAVHLASFNGWPMVLAPVLGFDTEFAPGYTASAFRDVREGMTYDEVVVQLGEPLHGLTSGAGYGAGYYTGFLVGDEEFCVWSSSPNGSHHSMRAIHFRDGVVFKKVAGFHWD